MQVIIHRGTHQIGGCATEIRTGSTRILIDLAVNYRMQGEGFYRMY